MSIFGFFLIFFDRFRQNRYHQIFLRIEIYDLTNFEPKRTRPTFILVDFSIFRFWFFSILSKNQFFPRFCVKVVLPKFSLYKIPVRMQNIRPNGWNYGGLVTKKGYRLVKKRFKWNKYGNKILWISLAKLLLSTVCI